MFLNNPWQICSVIRADSEQLFVYLDFYLSKIKQLLKIHFPNSYFFPMAKVYDECTPAWTELSYLGDVS